MTKTERITFRLTVDQNQKLNELAELSGKKPSSLVNEMIDCCINNKPFVLNKGVMATHLLNAINIINAIESQERILLKRELEAVLCQI